MREGVSCRLQLRCCLVVLVGRSPEVREGWLIVSERRPLCWHDATSCGHLCMSLSLPCPSCQCWRCIPLDIPSFTLSPSGCYCWRIVSNASLPACPLSIHLQVCQVLRACAAAQPLRPPRVGVPANLPRMCGAHRPHAPSGRLRSDSPGDCPAAGVMPHSPGHTLE
jgi:hypothetical protein